MGVGSLEGIFNLFFSLVSFSLFPLDFARWRRDVGNNVKTPIPQDDMLLEQSIQITDKFGFDHDDSKTANTDYHQTEKIFTSSELFGCLNGYGRVFCFDKLAFCIFVYWFLFLMRKSFNL